MSGPRRWLDGGDALTPEERRALEADLGRKAPPHAKRAVRAALSLKLAAASAAAAAPALRGSAQKAAATKLVSLSLLKSVAVGFALSAAVGIAVSLREQHGAAPDLARNAVQHAARAPSPPEPPGLANRGAMPPAEPSSSVTDAPPSRTSRRAVARDAAGEPSSLPGAASESQRVAEARALLRSGRAAEALATLQLLERDEPNGLLVQEREALAIQALAALGQREAARQRAAEFAARYPASPHLLAVRRAAE